MMLSLATVAGTGAGEEKVRELVEMHDLRTSVSIGDYYLKQQTLLAVRALLARVGREDGLGADWNPDNPYWRRAEEALLEQVMPQVDAEFADLAWLKPLWVKLDESEFSDEEIDALLVHFRSEVGRKQLLIVDHTVSTHVMTTLSFSGKLRDVPGAERERTRMQQLWNEEDRNMRFSVEGTMNVDAQRFALSPLGRKYFVTAVLKLTGIVNRRIDDLAARLPGEVEANIQRVLPIVREYKNARG